jgi:hypothetical protein
MSEISCHPLPEFDATNWQEIERVFAKSEELTMAQPWRKTIQKGLLPATVRTGWTEQGFWAYAVLQDNDIFNEADGPNQFTWTLGDVFEIFAQARRGGKYYEIHVTPDNHVCEMEWPNEKEISRFRGMSHEDGMEATRGYFVEDTGFTSYTLREEGQWRVLSFMPASMLYSETLTADERGRISFCRYDVTRDAAGKHLKPVIASTSPHTKPNFHIQREWRDIVFCADE